MAERPNRYKAACGQAARTARRAQEELSPPGGHPLVGALTTLQEAWASPSRQRHEFQAALDDLSHRLAHAFEDTATDLAHTAAAEPATVDTDDPAHAWKASFTTTRSHPRAL